MQTPPPYSHKEQFPFFVQIVAKCSETNEKSIFRFIFGRFCSQFSSFFNRLKCKNKMSQKMRIIWNGFLSSWFFFMRFLVFDLRSAFRTRQTQIKNYVRGLHPPRPPVLWGIIILLCSVFEIMHHMFKEFMCYLQVFTCCIIILMKFL